MPTSPATSPVPPPVFMPQISIASTAPTSIPMPFSEAKPVSKPTKGDKLVRLNADLSPPHWKKEAGGKWDAGYQHTGYFLEYLEKRFGRGTVRRLNEKLRIERYEEKRFWTELCGRPVKQLWEDYSEYLEAEKRKSEEEERVIVEKEDATIPESLNLKAVMQTLTLITKTKDTPQKP
ncbi:hypothetical protein DID88_005808 [Monilinia fructigena]|uniref:Uncharacterized protein n=1 Tax=Monilinia fructigena TaxID=38457 RepID=A0A395J1J2_9HELO|nr:hypothetical protein DID88_005808 [Monilinia fructigena]